MNDRSSRAHALVILSLKQQRASTGISRSSRLFLADLGGSEKTSKSKVEAGKSRVTGEGGEFLAGFEKDVRMREAVNINLGLLALKRCIEALNLQQVRAINCVVNCIICLSDTNPNLLTRIARIQDNQRCYVPYQDSKLTMLLSQGLGGNCKTSVVICAALDPTHAAETMSTLRCVDRPCVLVTRMRKYVRMWRVCSTNFTLPHILRTPYSLFRFGERCALVENEARNGASLLAGVLAALDEEIAATEKAIVRFVQGGKALVLCVLCDASCVVCLL